MEYLPCPETITTSTNLALFRTTCRDVSLPGRRLPDLISSRAVGASHFWQRVLRTGQEDFSFIRLKPFKPPSLSEEAVSLRVNLGYELVGGTSDGEGRDCPLYPVPLWIARGYDGYAIR